MSGNNRAKIFLENPLETLLDIGKKAFKPYLHEDIIASFWWPRFEKLAHSFISLDEELHENVITSHSEVGGRLTFNLLTGRQFTLTTRADRIDETNEGLKIYDYKTGSNPSPKEVEYFLASQLPLTGLIAKEGGIKNIKSGHDIAAMGYISLKENRDDLSATVIKDADTLSNKSKAEFICAT